MRDLRSALAANPLPERAPSTEGSLRVRVRYCECDPMGVAHHGSYIPWLEMARTELLRSSGVSYAQLEGAGIFLVVAKLSVAYRRPILYDDVIEVRCRVSGGGRVKIEHAYEIHIVERNNTALSIDAAGANTTLACVDREGRIGALPEWLMPV
ncbi:MAG: acyl-CoA thioesterase [Phycisphaeraceae bacterium]|nr:MAG: acyl-CoA thioesterase [Phycisphaeraceae bacterium]